jgi:hypothetical protein
MDPFKELVARNRKTGLKETGTLKVVGCGGKGGKNNVRD